MAVAVFNVRVSERPANGPFLTALGQFWQMLTNLDAGRLRWYRVELTTYLLGSVWF